MKIIEMQHLDDCLGRSLIRDVHFDEPFDEAFIEHLGCSGKLSYFKEFARPFFRLDLPGHFTFKGVQGALSGRLVLTGDPEMAEAAFRQIVTNFDRPEGGQGEAALGPRRLDIHR